MPPDPLGQRAQIINTPLYLKEVLSTEINGIEKRKREENEAVEEMERQRAEEIERGREEVIHGTTSKEITPKVTTLPVCTGTPKMLITGTLIIH